MQEPKLFCPVFDFTNDTLTLTVKVFQYTLITAIDPDHPAYLYMLAAIKEYKRVATLKRIGIREKRFMDAIEMYARSRNLIVRNDEAFMFVLSHKKLLLSIFGTYTESVFDYMIDTYKEFAAVYTHKNFDYQAFGFSAELGVHTIKTGDTL